MPSAQRLEVVGAGLAGCEAAWQAAERGLDVVLVEMKPERFSPAHSLGGPGGARVQQFAALQLAPKQRRRPSQGGDASPRLPGRSRPPTRPPFPPGRALAVDRARLLAPHHRGDRGPSTRIALRHQVVTELPDDSGRCDRGDRPAHRPSLLAERAPGPPRGRAPLLLRCARAHRLRGLHRSRRGVPRLALRGRRGRLPEPARSTRRVRGLRRRRCAPPRPCRCTPSRPISTSRAACPSRRWRVAGRMTLAYGPMKPVGLRDPRTGRAALCRGAAAPGGQARRCSTTSWASRRSSGSASRSASSAASRASARPSSRAAARCTATPT